MNKCSFWKLINEHTVDIPIIQRDYAQGRETPITSEIRREFVRKLKEALASDNTIHLNFIYGKIHSRKDPREFAQNKHALTTMLKAVEGYSKSLNLSFDYKLKEDGQNLDENLTSFIPLDGQQRLTTLYLLHFYLLRRLKNDSIEKLKNFSYHIRQSTKDFCEALINNPFEITNEITLSTYIKDAHWFLLFWEKDPSVKGMLTMLDEIHTQCGPLDPAKISDMWKGLKHDPCPISFSLLDLDQLDLTDELYVKMNSRGEALTHFENFKAWLLEFIVENEIDIKVANWSQKLDTTWCDLFWDNKDDDNMLVDDEYMRFFRNMMQIFYVRSNSVDPNTEDGKKNRTRAIDRIAPRGYPFVPHSEIKLWDVLTEDNINEMFRILDVLSCLKLNDRDSYRSLKPVFKGFITGKITFYDKVLFYGTARYLLAQGPAVKYTKLSAFLYFLKKLTTNQEIDDISIIKTICNGFRKDETLFEPLYQNLVDKKMGFSGFREEQVKEEQIKAGLILRDQCWWKLLRKAEKFKFFKGQIGFLFHLSKIDSYYDERQNVDWPIEINEKMKAEFTIYFDIATKLVFTAQGINPANGNLVERSLLTYEDGKAIFHEDGSKLCFPKDADDRDYGWRRYLRGYSAKGDPLKVWKVLEHLFVDLANRIPLDQIVNKAKLNDWRKCFIKYPETINYCGKYKWFLDSWEGKLLLTRSDRRTDYRELESLLLYKEQFENQPAHYHPFTTVTYCCGNTDNGYPRISFTKFSFKDYSIVLDVTQKNYKWIMEFSASDSKNLLESSTPFIEAFSPDIQSLMKPGQSQLKPNNDLRYLCLTLANQPSPGPITTIAIIFEALKSLEAKETKDDRTT